MRGVSCSDGVEIPSGGRDDGERGITAEDQYVTALRDLLCTILCNAWMLHFSFYGTVETELSYFRWGFIRLCEGRKLISACYTYILKKS